MYFPPWMNNNQFNNSIILWQISTYKDLWSFSCLILHQMWHIIHQNNRIEKTFNVVNSICGFAHAYSPNDTFSNRCRFLSYTTNLIINLIFFYQNAIIQLHFDVYIMLISLFKVTFRMENKNDILNLDKSYDKLTRNKSDCLKWVFDSVT